MKFLGYWKSASTLPVLIEKRTSTSIPINTNCHNKNQSLLREQIIHFIHPKQIYSNDVFINTKILRDIRTHNICKILVDLVPIAKRKSYLKN